MWLKPIFCSKLMYNFFYGKSSPKIWTASVILKEFAKVNNRPLGESSHQSGPPG
jgi:hypothetical protein